MSESKKKIPLSIRMEANLFSELDRYLGAIPWDERPSKDSMVQLAIRQFLAGGANEGIVNNQGEVENLPVDIRSLPHSEQQCFRDLWFILRHGEAHTRTAIAQNLKEFAKYTKLLKGTLNAGQLTEVSAMQASADQPHAHQQSVIDADALKKRTEQLNLDAAATGKSLERAAIPGKPAARGKHRDSKRSGRRG